MHDLNADVARMTSQLRFWDTKLQKLEATAAQTGADLSADLQQQIEELRSKTQAIQEELDKTQRAIKESSSAEQSICCAPGDISGTCSIKEEGELENSEEI